MDYAELVGRKQDWWKSDKDDAHGSVFAALEALDDNQDYRRQANLHHMRMYSNRLALGLSGSDYAVPDSGDRIKMNVCKAVVDAAVAHIATNRPRPMFLTTGGNIENIKKAIRLGRFISGQFYACKQYMKALEIFRDACVFGTGFEKVYERDGHICCERVFPDEILIDDNDGRYGEPRSLYQHKEVDREVIKGVWGEDAAEDAKLIRDQDNNNRSSENSASVVEAWHLPSSCDADDGRHVICVSGKTLLDESWTRQRFPFAAFRWGPAPLGYYGIGLVEELSSIQIEINYICQKIQRLMTYATSMVWTQKGSGVASISNQDWAHREYKGQPPIFQVIPPVAQQYFDHLDRLYARAFEIAGISQLAATSQKPSGLNSGEALRTYNDIGTRRFMHVGQRWEQFHLDLTELILDCARDIDERGDGDLKVLCAGDRDVEEIDFSDVSIEENKYAMKVWPTALLPDTPAGKLEMIEKLAQVSPEIGPHVVSLLTGIPDLEGVVSQVNAPMEIAQTMVNRIIEDGEPQIPYSQMDLQLARNVATKAWLRAEIDGIPEERQEMLLRYIEDIDSLQAAKEQPPAGMGPPEGLQSPLPSPSGGPQQEQPMGPMPMVPPMM